MSPRISPLPQEGAVTSPRSQHPPHSPLPQRSRALTASSTGTGSFYLGGTGGRAQRPRARDRALTVSYAGMRKDGVIEEGYPGQSEVIDDREEMAPPLRGRSATTSNATPIHASTIADTATPGYFGFRDTPSTPTRQGGRGTMPITLLSSRESVL